MRIRVLRKDHLVLALAAALFGLLLVSVSVAWPTAFGIVLAIGGTFGALMVIYEVRLTKRIAQAEFIRDLQTGFTSDASTNELWRKLLMKEPITAADRPLISSYLTFFETVHLLIVKGALDLTLVDDLFRNRFFTAVGDQGVLDTALISQAGAFTNIHDLIEVWHDHLVRRGVPMHPGYYSYVRALSAAKGYEVVRLTPDDLPALLRLQDEVLGSLVDREWLRDNSDVTLKECLTDQVVLGVRRADELVAAAVLYDGGRGEESIRRYFTDDPALLDRSVNLKLVLTAPGHRRAGLGRTLVELLEQHAVDAGKSEVLCTIHRGNAPSRTLFAQLGYRRLGNVRTPYGERQVHGRPLPTADRRWAR